MLQLNLFRLASSLVVYIRYGLNNGYQHIPIRCDLLSATNLPSIRIKGLSLKKTRSLMHRGCTLLTVMHVYD